MMDYVIWGGAVLSMLGVAGLVWCIVMALSARRASLPEAEMRARLQRIVVLNMAALAVSALGLMAVVVGIILS
jgi:hypothetical protein